MTPARKVVLTELVERSLDSAQVIWEAVGPLVVEAKAKSIELSHSDIPGFPIVSRITPAHGEFVALVVDQRGSSKALIESISRRIASVDMLERVLYQSSALLPLWASAVVHQGGSVTEYLGDGLLALFQVPNDEEREVVLYKSHEAAVECIEAMSEIANPILARRYKLPAVEAGVGLGLSNCVVTVVGIEEFAQAKAIGRCIYDASKLSKGRNVVCASKQYETAWPSTPTGTFRFTPMKFGEVEGFQVYPQ